MSMFLYSVFDEASEHFGPIMICRTDDEAKRVFRSAVMTPDSPIHQFPSDFKLYCLGTFDDEFGHVAPIDPIRCLAHGSDFAKEASASE